jgi:polar amino acid transport system substrate-binding protein
VAKVAIASLPPYAFKLPAGEPKGYLIEVMAEALKPLGVRSIEATTTTFDAMIPGLQARQFDFVPAGLNITNPRCDVVLFSSPLTVQQDALYVMPGNPKRLAGYASIAAAPDARFAVLVGSAQEAFALSKGAKPEQLVKVPDAQAGIAAVTGGRADAFVIGQFSIPNFAQRGVEAVVDKDSPPAGVGIALRKENAGTRDALNARLQQLRSDGTLKTLYEKHGFNNWETLAKAAKASDIATNCN